MPTTDQGLEEVAEGIVALARPDPTALFGDAIRRSIDEVLDGPRTGRWSFDQLEKTEKTYIGTKLEILIRSSLRLDRGAVLDLEIAGYPVDLKWAMKSVWQIPREAVGQLCVCIGGLNDLARFQVGIVRCTKANLNSGQNRDGKRTLSSTGRASMRLLVPPSPVPPNFVADMDPDVRERVLSGDTIQVRLTELFTSLPYTPLPRLALQTIARTDGDPIRRTRADNQASDPLRGMVVLSSKFGNAIVQALGHDRLEDGCFMAVPQVDIENLPNSAKRNLSPGTRQRYGLG